MELSDNEAYAANIMLIIAVNTLSIDYQQNPSVVHSLALEYFWNGIYSDAQVKSLKIEMNDKYSGLLVNSDDILETVGDLFSGLGQHDDIKLVEQLAGIYHLWVENIGISNQGVELTTAMLARPFDNHPQS